MTTLVPGRVRERARVAGTVQGVGFRPFVYRLAREEELGGFVLNDEHGVLIEVEGSVQSVRRFMVRLSEDAPPLASVDSVARAVLATTGERDFAIRRSARRGEGDALVAADTATCADCLAELFDPADRRHRYPFINCTNCGPRFTIVHGVPYDRPLTAMAAFVMCPSCRAEYEDPADRRFHAQPNACPACGPSLRLVGGLAEGDAAADPVTGAARAIRDGAIVAIKGLGGYHLACLAAAEDAVATLRGRKHRDDKPFAVMAPDVTAARRLVSLTPKGEALLSTPARPIVLARRQAGAPVAPGVAPRCADLGVMLPYTPIHHLLLDAVGAPLVMTSGNLSDEPIAYRDEDALERLVGIADLFLVHDRPIVTRTDDSVLRVGRDRTESPTVLVRRSRGYVPAALTLPVPAPPLLACGAELKNTFCVALGERAWVSHHIGDLRNWETLKSFREGAAHFEELFGVKPRLVVHDLHPDYLSTRYAQERDEVELLAVQHHHAHLAACLAEHRHPGPAIGVIYDGSGYGDDGTVWGGELLLGDLRGFERVGRLWPVRLPGGDRAVREPWRLACAWLHEAGADVGQLPTALVDHVPDDAWRAVSGMVASGFQAPWTSSVGRLFDAVAALCGIRSQVAYEGQAAAELESAAENSDRGGYALPLTDDMRLDARKLIRAVCADVANGVSAGAISTRFHRGLASGTAAACRVLAQAHGVDTVALSGGVFQNRLLLELLCERLRAEGLRVLVPQLLPPSDGGISFGQAAVAAARGEAR